MAGALPSVGRRDAGSVGTARRALGWLATGVLLLLACRRALADPLNAPLPTPANTALTSGQDFRDAAYYPLKELLSGGDPYDPGPMLAHWPVRQEFDLYAPLHLVLHLPYAFLPYRAGLVIYSCVGLAYLIAIGLVSARVSRLPGGWLAAWLVAAGVVLAQFGKSAIYFGQINTLVGLGAVLAITQVGRGGDRWSSPALLWGSAGLALAWIKPQFGIPITVLVLARGAWRQAALGTALAGVASLPVVAVLVVRAGGLGGFLDVVRRNLAYATGTGYGAVDSPSGARVDVAAVVFRLTGWVPPGAEVAVLLAVLGLSGWLLGAAARRGRPFDLPELLLVSLAVLVCIVHQQSESLITVPAIVGTAALLIRRERLPDGLSGPVLVASALLWVPVVHVSAFEHLLIGRVGAHWDSLIEGLSLNLAFVVVAAALLTRSVQLNRPVQPNRAVRLPPVGLPPH